MYEAVTDTREDAELVADVAMGSEDALHTLFDRHGGSVLALARHMLGSREEAEEVLQDTFLRLHRHAARFEPEQAALRTWLYAIARNLCLTHLRARNSRPRSDPEIDPHGAAFAATVGTTTDLLPAILVRDGLARLEPEERALLRAAFYQGYSHAELAERHGLPLGTVKSKVRRALLKLRALWPEETLADGASGDGTGAA